MKSFLSADMKFKWFIAFNGMSNQSGYFISGGQEIAFIVNLCVDVS